MKKLVLSTLSLTLFAAAGAAHAQNSVTLYGLLDTGLTYSSNSGGHSNIQQASGILNGNRWGLRGSEDLGNGLKAIFTLESGFNLSTGAMGQNSRLFGRQAFVGLASNQYGSVTLGRQYDNLVDNLGPLSLNGTQYGGTLASHPYDNDNLNNSFRVSNSVKYQSVDYAGFKLGAMYGFSNEADGFSDNRAYSVGASYAFGGLKVAAAYLQLNGAGSSNTSGAVSTDATFTASRQRTYGAGVSYAFGPANVGFVFTQTQLASGTLIGTSASGKTSGIALNGTGAHFTNFELNGRYAITPAWSVSGAYTYTDASLLGADPKYHQVTLQSDYALSRRTDVYAEAAYQHVGSTGSTGSSGITAHIVGVSASSTDSQVVGTVGIRHRF